MKFRLKWLRPSLVLSSIVIIMTTLDLRGRGFIEKKISILKQFLPALIDFISFSFHLQLFSP